MPAEQVSKENLEVLDTKQLLKTLVAVKKGNFSVRMPIEQTGMAGKIADTLNDIIDQNERMANELKRISIVVGKEGRITQRASLAAAGGSWTASIDSVNTLITDLVQPMAETARVIRAVAHGDLSQTIGLEIEGRSLKGDFLQTAQIVNTMVAQLSSFASEVTRVAREVGSEGKLGVQADVKGVAGTWKDLTDNVNSMAGNLTGQVRNIAEVTTAVANGDLSKKITVDVKGEILELKKTINTMVDQLSSFASEVTRVAREVGSEGKLGVQADVKGVAGTWKDLTDNVNSMAGNLTAQVRNIAEVTTAVANGDLSKKITVDVKGEILELKNTVNVMVDQLSSFASEVTRVAREVGSEGKLGGQADVKGVAGTWKDLTESVNSMAGSLTAQVRNIAEVTTAVANGDLSKKITVAVKGEILELKNTVNVMVDQLNSFASEVTRVAREVGSEGKLGVQADVCGVAGTWKDLTDNVNSMAGNLTAQVRNIAEVTKAVANGDLSKKITVTVKGEILDLKDTINVMVDQPSSFASEVTRVAREVGSEGKLGGQADVKGVAGTWKDLTDSVNLMAGNLTAQVRGIARVVTAVANGDLKRKLALGAKGEIETLADTINEMIDTLATFADQVTTVAREVGIEGKLGGQARVPGASGTWRDLTDNVNELAANLTTQVRAIAEVAIAVTKGDLTRSIAVQAQGEVAILKDNINQMIANLRETTQENTEQDWLKTNLAKFTRMLQGQRDLEAVSKLILSELAPLVSAQQGVFYLMDGTSQEAHLKMISSYAYRERKHLANQFHLGEGLVGQCALEKERILITEVPDNYIKISSGLGEAKPLNAVVLPVLFEGHVTAVIELASFQHFNEIHLNFFDQLTESIAIVLNTIAASMRTEELLKQSQSMAEELQTRQKELTETNERLEQQAKSLQSSEELLKNQQEELQQTNQELEEKARLLSVQNQEVERKNREIDQARMSVEEKAEQLALTSKYKSEFLANMSHELRTPLNSLLILSRLLSNNPEGNLTTKQVDYTRTIHSAGSDLLGLINDILDLAKIESGTMSIEIDQILFTDLRANMEGTFRQVAQDKQLAFMIEFSPELPRSIHTDPKRLEQVLKNLLSNAFKFTAQGQVTLRAEAVTQGWSPEHEMLTQADKVVAFSVKDTGIGIAADKQKVIFEAFQQADGTTSRKYGGTGLGLSISREIARLLGGEIRLVSHPGQGSTFTLYLPQPDQTDKEDASWGKPPSGTPICSLSKGTPLVGSRTVLLSENSAIASSKPGTVTPSPHSPLPVGDDLALAPSPGMSEVTDDRDVLQPGELVLLIIEDDITFTQCLLEQARGQRFKGLIASRGDTGLDMARQFKPDAIILDIQLAVMDGWRVLEHLKRDPVTRHIPVQIISIEEERHRSLQLGALGYLKKPVPQEALTQALVELKNFVERPLKHLLLVEDNEAQRNSIVELIGSSDVQITAVETATAALAALKAGHFDCAVLDLGLPDISGFEVIEQIKEDSHLKLPIIIYTGQDLTPQETNKLNCLAEMILVKDVRSPEQLLEQTTLYLHRNQAKLPAPQQQILEHLRLSISNLAGKKILIVDDDYRNIFALSSLLENNQMEVVYAENGRAGIEVLQNTPEIHGVLMDVMMPEMDGYETIRAIRALEQFKTLPIIAVTAKAMKGDREKCLAAGASDYITKPVDPELLLARLRIWLT